MNYKSELKNVIYDIFYMKSKLNNKQDCMELDKKLMLARELLTKVRLEECSKLEDFL